MDIPDIVEATLEYFEIVPDNGVAKIEGQIKAGKRNIPIKCMVEMYQIISDAYDNGNYIGNIISSKNYKIMNISFGKSNRRLLLDENFLESDNITQIAVYDETEHRIYSVEQQSDSLHLLIVESIAKTITPSDDLYIDLSSNANWFQHIIRQKAMETEKFDYINVNEIEDGNIHKKSSEALVDRQVDPEVVRQQKGEYETLKSNNYLHDGHELISQNPSMATTATPTIDSSISACVNYVGYDKFMTPHKTYERTPTSYDPTGYYMVTNDGGNSNVITPIIGYQIINMAPKDDTSNSSFAFIRLDIIWSYVIQYSPSINKILNTSNSSGFRLRNMQLAMNTDEDSTDYFYRMIANAKTRNGVGTVSNPAVNLALKVIPGGTYVNLGLTVWNGLFTVASSVTANGANGSADKSWSSVDSTHQQQMLALTGNSGYNRVVNVDCLQGLDDKWLATSSHYMYMDTYVKSTGAVKNKWMQYTYKFSICDQNGFGYFYTVSTVNDYFYRSYCR